MIWFYRLLFIPLFVISFPYYAMRMLKRGGYSKDFSHRFGSQKNLPPVEKGKKRIWLQAVSVGEIEALSTFYDSIVKNGNIELVVTTTTSTAYKILQEKFADKCYYIGVFPLDFYLFSKRAWGKIKPDIALLMEGELWPEHIHQASVHNVPLILLNARMSDRSFARFSKFPYFSRRLLDKFQAICTSSQFDAKRFVALGASKLKVFVTGNMKFDSKPTQNLDQAGKIALKKELGFEEDSFVLLGSSTWQGEEAMLVSAMQKIRLNNKIDCRLLLVPRHAERREEILPLFEGISHNVRSQSKQAKDGTLIYLADTTGELRNLTQIADLAFIGKSLPPNVGGQTPIDCAALGVPMVYGAEMSNFRRVCETLERDGAVIKVPTADEAISELVRISKKPQLLDTLAHKAKHWHTSNVGATERTIDILNRL